MSAPATTVEAAIAAALSTVDDPEIRRPITELGMVRDVVLRPDGVAVIGLLLTVAGCPLKDKLRNDITNAVGAVDGVTGVEVDFGVMTAEQRKELQGSLRGDAQEPVIPFAQPGSRTRVYAVASGKGGVGKSSVRSTWPRRSPRKACGSASSTPTSTATRCPACSAPTAGPRRSSR